MANHRAAAILTIASRGGRPHRREAHRATRQAWTRTRYTWRQHTECVYPCRDSILTVGACALAVYFASDAVTVPALSCSKVHGVKAGETCFSMAQATRLKQDVFLGFNPNINCENVFVGQWVCLAATSA